MRQLIAAVLVCTSLVGASAQAQTNDASAQARFATARAALDNDDYATAAPLLIDLCEEGYTTCVVAAQLTMQGAGTPQDTTKAISLFERACSQGVRDGCGALTAIYNTDEYVSADPVKSFGYTVASCGFGDALACWSVGDRYERGDGTEKDLNKAADFYQVACDNETAGACTDLGNLHTQYRGNPESGPTRDYDKAAALYRRACDLDDGRGCSLLADLYEVGLGVPKDLDAALELYRKAAGMDVAQWVRTSVEGRIRALEAQQ